MYENIILYNRKKVMYEDNVRIVYVKKKILIKEVSKEWYIKTNGIKDIILDKENIIK